MKDINTLNLTIFLICIFQLKHFIADYLLQTHYMLGKFKGGSKWIKPLAAHAGVHAFLTYAICIYFLFNKPHYISINLAILDFTIHFIVDRIKASPHLLGKFHNLNRDDYIYWKETISGRGSVLLRHNKIFWIALGLDQMLHHLTDAVIVFVLIKSYI